MIETAHVIDSRHDLSPDFRLEDCRRMPHPTRLLLCPPAYFQVVDVKNPFMAGNLGKVDSAQAMDQWEKVKATFEAIGMRVEVIQATPGLEDMVFTANQTFPGLDRDGTRICLLSHMKHESRRLEVSAFSAWFRAHQYTVIDPIERHACFEGGGDAIWHPGRGLIWGGHGARSSAAVYRHLSEVFGVPVITLELPIEHFYHLDTCFCPLDERTVMLFPPSLTKTGLGMVHHVFDRVIEVPEQEAVALMVCNAASFFGRKVVIQRGSRVTRRNLEHCGFEVHEVETGEFIKSGGSVYCMKMAFF